MNLPLLCALALATLAVSLDAAGQAPASTPKQMDFQLVEFEKPIKRATAPVTEEEKARVRGKPCPQPEYPYGAKMRKEEGTTRIRVVIQPDGFLSHLKVIQSSGSKELDEAALSTIGGCWFPPAEHGMNEYMETSYTWKL